MNYVGARAYLSGGPLILHGLWNYTGSVGVASGNTKVLNSIRVTGDPEGALATQPYVFVFFENKAFSSQGFQWAPDVHTWYLMPGVYRYEVMLADYNVASGHIVVGSSPVTLSVALHYNDLMGVYTPLWAFGNGQLAGISTTGDGTRSHQYIPFNNPTTGYGGTRAGKLNPLFFSFNDYFYPSFPGVLISGYDRVCRPELAADVLGRQRLRNGVLSRTRVLRNVAPHPGPRYGRAGLARVGGDLVLLLGARVAEPDAPGRGVRVELDARPDRVEPVRGDHLVRQSARCAGVVRRNRQCGVGQHVHERARSESEHSRPVRWTRARRGRGPDLQQQLQRRQPGRVPSVQLAERGGLFTAIVGPVREQRDRQRLVLQRSGQRRRQHLERYSPARTGRSPTWSTASS